MGWFAQSFIEYGIVIEEFSLIQSSSVRKIVASAFLNKSIVCEELGLDPVGLDVLRRFLALFGPCVETGLHEHFAKGLVNFGLVLGRLGFDAAAIEQFDRVDRLFGTSQEAVLLEQVARALFSKSKALSRDKRLEEADSNSDRLIERFAASSLPVIQVQVAKALFDKAIARQSGDRREAMRLLSQIERSYADSNDPELRALVAQSLYVFADFSLRIGGSSERALAIWSAVADRYDADRTIDARFTVIRALTAIGHVEHQRRNHALASKAFLAVLGRSAAVEGTRFRLKFAEGKHGHASALEAVGKYEDALSSYNDVIVRFQEDNRNDIQERVSKSFFMIGLRLSDINRIRGSEEAIRLIDDLGTTNEVIRAFRAIIAAKEEGHEGLEFARRLKLLLDRVPASQRETMEGVIEASLKAAAQGLTVRFRTMGEKAEVEVGNLAAPTGHAAIRAQPGHDGPAMPEPPAGFIWPIESFSGSSEYGKAGGWIKYFRRVWGPMLRAGARVTRDDYRAVDPSGKLGLRQYLKKPCRSPGGNPAPSWS